MGECREAPDLLNLHLRATSKGSVQMWIYAGLPSEKKWLLLLILLSGIGVIIFLRFGSDASPPELARAQWQRLTQRLIRQATLKRAPAPEGSRNMNHREAQASSPLDRPNVRKCR